MAEKFDLLSQKSIADRSGFAYADQIVIKETGTWPEA
jgi:hypothetical protein